MAIAFILRVLPAIVTRDLAFFPVYDTDTWYNLRQIEVMVHNFPQYNWFDPMTAYPAGKIIDWGPGLPFIAAVFCIIAGAATQNAIVAAAGFVSPLMAVLMVPVMYYLGLKIADWKTGIAAAGLMSFTSFLYFTFSSYGMVDHHIAEVLFSTLFILVYVSAISSVKAHPPDRNNLKTAAVLLGSFRACRSVIFRSPPRINDRTADPSHHRCLYTSSRMLRIFCTIRILNISVS